MKSKAGSVTARFKVQLRSIKPPVWRRFDIDYGATFLDLHEAIQQAMGWLDCHLHAFHLDGLRGEGQITIAQGLEGDRILPSPFPLISEFLTMDSPQALYIYDFGDDWAHDVSLESLTRTKARLEVAIVLGGNRACPPEDCGGVPGYEDLVTAMRDPKHPERSAYLDWLGQEYDPEEWSPPEEFAGKR